MTQKRYDEFYRFLEESGQPLPMLPASGWKNRVFDPRQPRLPMEFASWVEAIQCLAYFGKRLPTEAEWEAAARGPEGSVYPWGDAWDETKVNRSGELRPVDSHGGEGFTFGLYHMIGNVPEWTADRYLPYPGSTFVNLAMPNFDVNQRVLRGGSCVKTAPDFFLVPSFRNPGRPGFIDIRIGARGARSDVPRLEP